MLIDTNILVYAVNSASPKQKIAQHFLQEQKSNLFVAHQNICEAFRILTHPKFSSPMSEKKSIESINRITSALSRVSPDSGTIDITLALTLKYHIISNMIFDAYLVATALTNGITVIATDNERHFRIFKEITVYNPFAKDLN